MRVAEIRVHPIKSCRPVRRRSARVVRGGLEHDRRYMVVDRTGNFVTLRTLPELAFIDVVIDDASYRVTLPDGATFDLPHVPDGPLMRVGIWGSAVVACEDLGGSAALSAWAGVDLRLVAVAGEQGYRPLRDDLGVVAFADAWPVLGLSRESVDDLSARVGAPMAMDRFRPNLVFEGGAAYAEDRWAHVRIGSASLTGGALCSRCVATTIDPATGDMGREPLTTLAGYRRFDSSVYLGVNFAPDGGGEITEGDGVEILRVVEPRLPL